ncbi:MAG: SH3 domain-containing protein [Clostridiales bacterium]|nr:SH3 domain-containing protein [Clostridiales bacterium]
MKRAFALILTLTLLLTMLALPAAQADNYATATVKGGWLRLREGASNSAKTISAYFTGTTVTILGQSGAWYNVLTPDGKVGYMHSGYLTINGAISGSEPGESTTGVVKSANGKPVRLRSGPSVQYTIIASYNVGTPLTVLNVGADWSKVRINGRVGYMMNEFINFAPGSAVGGYTAYVVSANGRGVVLRSGPSKDDEVLATYQVGQVVTVLSYGSTWCKVRVNGLDGYMMSEFLSTVKPEVSEPNYGTAYTAYVTSQNGKGVRMRMGAGKIFPTVATYSVGTKVTVLEYGATWCKIRVGSNTGYMMTEFLTTKAPSMVGSVAINLTTVQPGDTLKATVSPANVSVSIAWINDKGVTLGYGSAYTVQESDVGRRIRASVTGTGATSGTAVSSWATVKESYVSRVYLLKSVTISDTTPIVGQTLTATLSPAGATATISWFRDNGVFVGSGSTYKVKAADEGYRLYAWADGTGNTSGEATSERTSAVAPAAPSTIVLQGVGISNMSPRVGDTLKAELSPKNTTASFTWRSSAGHILGYGDTYTVAADDVGNSIYVYANGTGATSGSVVSSLTAQVQAKVDTTVRIDSVILSSTSPVVGQTLYAAVAPSAASATFTWLRDDDKILSTTSSYTVQPDDVGHTLYVWADGANGTFGSATSKITAPVAEK